MGVNMEAVSNKDTFSSIFNLPPSDISKLRFDVIVQAASAMAIKAGVKDEFLELFKKGSEAWKIAWGNVKDKATRAAISSLRTAKEVRDFLANNPKLILSVLAGFLLGQLSIPSSVSAEWISPTELSSLANQMRIGYDKGSTKVTVGIPDGWAEQIILWSMKGHSLQSSNLTYFKDLQDNVRNVCTIKMNQYAKLWAAYNQDPSMRERSKDIEEEVKESMSKAVETKVVEVMNKIGMGKDMQLAQQVGFDIGVRTVSSFIRKLSYTMLEG